MIIHIELKPGAVLLMQQIGTILFEVIPLLSKSPKSHLWVTQHSMHPGSIYVYLLHQESLCPLGSGPTGFQDVSFAWETSEKSSVMNFTSCHCSWVSGSGYSSLYASFATHSEFTHISTVIWVPCLPQSTDNFLMSMPTWRQCVFCSVFYGILLANHTKSW